MHLNSGVLPIIGISPRNSYYGDSEHIAFVLSAVVREHGTAFVMIPDLPDVKNYLAYGYNNAYAWTKAHDVAIALKRSVRETCERGHLSVSAQTCVSADVRLIDWGHDVELSPIYQSSRNRIGQLYRDDAIFRADARAATQTSIETRIKNNSSTRNYVEKVGMETVIDVAVDYVLSEISFLDVAQDLFGGNRTEYIYHRSWPIFRKAH